jgi:putative transposase
MKYDPAKHHRRSIRLKGFDYHSAGAYFITICTKNREPVLNDPMVNGIIRDVWQALPLWFPSIKLDQFVVMSNHLHFVVWLGVETHPADAAYTPVDNGKPRPYRLPIPQSINMTPSLGDVVGAFKSLVFTVYLDWIKSHTLTRHAKFWQANYYEHIIRSDKELNAIRQYIINNPINWNLDRDNPENLRRLPRPQMVEEYFEDIKPLMPG